LLREHCENNFKTNVSCVPYVKMCYVVKVLNLIFLPELKSIIVLREFELVVKINVINLWNIIL
jgi:hypothetical protein